MRSSASHLRPSVNSRAIYLLVGTAVVAMSGAAIGLGLATLFAPAGLCVAVADLLARWPACARYSTWQSPAGQPWFIQPALVAIGAGWILFAIAAFQG